jgi:hypothetical protein
VLHAFLFFLGHFLQRLELCDTDGADLGLLLSSWGVPGIGDLNSNGITDGVDLGLLLANWS